MDNNKTSLIHKLVSKGAVFTPLEAMHLKYLSRKGVIKELVDIETKANPYISAQETKSRTSDYFIGYLIDCAGKEDPVLYSAYDYAFENLFDLDNSIGWLGYKGLGLLTQLTSMRYEYFVRLIIDKESEKIEQQTVEEFNNATTIPLMDFSTYSFVHQKEVTYTEVLSSFGETFKYFIKSIDNILTLNYYLDQLIEVEELDCLLFLKKLINNGARSNETEHSKPIFNAVRFCCSDEIIKKVLANNHQDYVESFKNEVKRLPASFGESSLQYVTDIIITTINSAC